jgi:hypothetical protein
MKVRSPRCQQDYVTISEIRVFQKEFFLCPECDACWDNRFALKSTNQVYGLMFFDLSSL